jgi:adenosylcobinamide amidohydrolase
MDRQYNYSQTEKRTDNTIIAKQKRDRQYNNSQTENGQTIQL